MTARENARLVLQYTSDETSLGRAARRAATDVLQAEDHTDYVLGQLQEILQKTQGIEQKLCDHEWSEWSYTFSQTGSRACLKCEAVQRG